MIWKGAVEWCLFVQLALLVPVLVQEIARCVPGTFLLLLGVGSGDERDAGFILCTTLSYYWINYVWFDSVYLC